MPLVLKPIEAGKSKSRLKPEEIDADVALAIEEAFKFCADNPGQRLEAELGSKEAGDEFLHAARSYAYHREPRVTVTGNSYAKGARFRVEPYEAPAAEETPAE